MASRHGRTEALYGVTTPTVEEEIATPGRHQVATINETDTLTKTVDLTPFALNPHTDALGSAALVTAQLSAGSTEVALTNTSWLQLTTDIQSSGAAGLVFDYYSATDFKFVLLDVSGQRILLGHHSPRGGWAVDAVHTAALSAERAYAVEVNLQGASASITVDGEFMTSTSYNSGVVDGKLGLLARSGAGAFDWLRIRTDDPVFIGTA